MKKEMYETIEKHMLSCMNDAAHDSQHIYRVLYSALDLAGEFAVDNDVLLAAALLHDIGREAQFKNSKFDHAIVGAEMAYKYLLKIGWNENKAAHVRACISSHSYRNSNPPDSIEAKILFDADKLDAAGTMGIARTLIYQGIVSVPLYYVDTDGNVIDDGMDNKPSFFKEYNWKLRNVYDKFYTDRAKAIGEERRKAGIDFFESMYNEVCTMHKKGVYLLNQTLEKD